MEGPNKKERAASPFDRHVDRRRTRKGEAARTALSCRHALPVTALVPAACVLANTLSQHHMPVPSALAFALVFTVMQSLGGGCYILLVIFRACSLPMSRPLARGLNSLRATVQWQGRVRRHRKTSHGYQSQCSAGYGRYVPL